MEPTGWDAGSQHPPPELSYVIPAHNSAAVIEQTLEAVAKRLDEMPAEIVVVENGSTDGTVQLLERIRQSWPGDAPPLTVLSCPRGLGNALRHGITHSAGRTIVITADDLPFGFDELDAAQQLGNAAGRVVIGSKGHPRSEVGRSVLRSVLTAGHRTLRWVILGMRVADPQGTYVMDGAWARSIAPELRETGFLFTTELAYAATLSGIRPVEVPVRLRESTHASRVRLADVYLMGVGLISIRRRGAALRAASGRSRRG